MDRLVDNLRALMADPRYDSQPKLAEATGVSQTHIGNILRKDRIPSIEIVEQLAAGLGLKTWQLLAPPGLLERGMNREFNDLLEWYLATDQAGRETILRVAEATSTHQPSGSVD